MQKDYVGSRASDASSRLSSASTVRGSDAGFATGGSLVSSARCGFQTALALTADAMADQLCQKCCSWSFRRMLLPLVCLCDDASCVPPIYTACRASGRFSLALDPHEDDDPSSADIVPRSQLLVSAALCLSLSSEPQ
jgi:hypothetical protein